MGLVDCRPCFAPKCFKIIEPLLPHAVVVFKFVQVIHGDGAPMGELTSPVAGRQQARLEHDPVKAAFQLMIFSDSTIMVGKGFFNRIDLTTSYLATAAAFSRPCISDSLGLVYVRPSGGGGTFRSREHFQCLAMFCSLVARQIVGPLLAHAVVVGNHAGGP